MLVSFGQYLENLKTVTVHNLQKTQQILGVNKAQRAEVIRCCVAQWLKAAYNDLAAG